jgi:adenylate kinase
MQQEPQAFIFIGRSGCGKGTQVELFKNELVKKDGRKILHIETGNMLREFITGTSYTEALTKKTLDAGGLMPEAVVVYFWMKYLVDNFSGVENLLFDGAPRKLPEAILLDGALNFYGIKRYKVVFINVSRQWAADRLLARKRADDTEEAINKRMDWFENEVMKSIDFFRVDQHGQFIEINGEQSIDDVHKEIMNRIGL